MRLLVVVVLASGPALAIEPSFDCSKADSSAEEAVCKVDSLAELDLELARLYRLATNGPNMDPRRLGELKADQRGWIGGRNECWKASVPLERCVAESYALRMDEIRTGYADARSDDGKGITSGPFAYRCEGLDALISAVFINGSAPMVSLSWGDNAVVLKLEPAASGAKYFEDYRDGVFEFWTRGDEALLSVPGSEDLTCHQEPIG